MKAVPRLILLTTLTVLGALALAACGSDPTATPRATNTPSPTATPTATLAPGVPTPTPARATPTPTATAVPSRDMEAYFGGKTIQLYVGFSPGGGYDTFARLVARFAQRHFPGNPRFVVRNLPGAGGERALVAAMNSDPDGFTTITIHPRFFKRELLGVDVPSFDPATVEIIGTPDAAKTSTAQYVMRDIFESDGLPATWEGLLAWTEQHGPLKSGATAPGDSGGVAPTFMQALGGPVEMVYGYGGTSEIAAAFDRGEIQLTGRGSFQNASALFPEWIEDRRLVPVMWSGAPLDEDQNTPNLITYITEMLGEQVPAHVFDLTNPTEGQKAVFNLTLTVNDTLSRTYALPPGTPQDIVAIWRKSFEATVNDPDFHAAALLLGRPVFYAGPEEIKASLDAGSKALAEDPELRALFAALAGAEG